MTDRLLMQHPEKYYTEHKAQYSKERSSIKSALNISSSIRLLVFIGIGVGIYLGRSNYQIILAIVLLGIAAFLFLITRHSKLQYKRDLLQALIDANETELRVLKRDFYDLPDGKNFTQEQDFYSQDIDLFGRGSFFQYTNRTSLKSGGALLAHLFTANDIENIIEKQEAVKELGTLPEWRQRFTAIASLVKAEVTGELVVSWLKDYKPFIPSKAKVLSYVFSGISILVVSAYFLNILSGYWVGGIFGLGLLITGRFVKKINALSAQTGKIESTFEQYHKLLAEIEEQDMTSVLLSRKRTKVVSPSQSSSTTLKRFARLLDSFDQRNNIIVGFLTNGFFLRDLAIVSGIEKWIETYKNDVEVWFEVIAFFDAYNSLGNYDFNHPEHTYPVISNGITTLEAEGAAHPLLDPTIAIRNTIKIENEQFFIITGANMAGKSTFLRTVALQIVMGNMGLPVCARSASYNPIKLITSMRTTDSLTDDESYFFSELKRLKFIVDEIKMGRYFIILDEILKGTNSTDKAIGSRKFVDKLVASGATGIIATHDLSLCEAADDLENVENYYFDARIEDDELYFDYTFKKGICKNMNASFLLKKMEIVE